jgi:hypothetical protein
LRRRAAASGRERPPGVRRRHSAAGQSFASFRRRSGRSTRAHHRLAARPGPPAPAARRRDGTLADRRCDIASGLGLVMGTRTPRAPFEAAPRGRGRMRMAESAGEPDAPWNAYRGVGGNVRCDRRCGAARSARRETSTWRSARARGPSGSSLRSSEGWGRCPAAVRLRAVADPRHAVVAPRVHGAVGLPHDHMPRPGGQRGDAFTRRCSLRFAERRPRWAAEIDES